MKMLQPTIRRGVLFLCIALLIPTSAASAMSVPFDSVAERWIVVSLAENRLWLIEGSDTLLSAPVAIGRHESFRYRGKVFNWRTPQGERTVLGKRRNPVWTVPNWHYYERAATESLELVEMVRDTRYPLADGSYLTVIGGHVVRVLGQQYWKVPQGREIVVGRVLFIPPLGTAQRKVPGVLGTRALDLGDGYLIHGTSPYNQASIGGAASHGCVRMHTADVEKLFDLVTEGTRVLIQ